MAEPVPFRGMNVNMTGEGLLDLPACVAHTDSGRKVTTCCIALTNAEVREINETCRVWFSFIADADDPRRIVPFLMQAERPGWVPDTDIPTEDGP